MRLVRIGVWAAVGFAVAFLPNIGPAVKVARSAPFAIDGAWNDALIWLRDNTPEPSTDADFYYRLYDPPGQGVAYSYPEASYSVAAWWDYGHWITRVARRMAIANPFQQGADWAGRFLLSDDQAAIGEMADALRVKYVVVDSDTTLAKFHGLATFAGKSSDDYYDVYYQRVGNTLQARLLFYPEYYRSLAVRLYQFDGKKVSAEAPKVISYVERADPDGVSVKEITGVQAFGSYAEAASYVAKQATGNFRIVSDNPRTSPVALEQLDGFRLAYSPDRTTVLPGFGPAPAIKVFEYARGSRTQ